MRYYNKTNRTVCLSILNTYIYFAINEGYFDIDVLLDKCDFKFELLMVPIHIFKNMIERGGGVLGIMKV